MNPRRLLLLGACLVLALWPLVPWAARRCVGGPRIVFDPPPEEASPADEGEQADAPAPGHEQEQAAAVEAPPGPRALAQRSGPAPISDRTSIVVLQLGPGAALLSWAEKPLRFLAPDLPEDARARYRLEDARTGALLHEGPCDLPTPCRCALGRDHADGCAVFRHDPVVRLKLPRLAERERVTLLASGRTVGTFLLEAN